MNHFGSPFMTFKYLTRLKKFTLLVVDTGISLHSNVRLRSRSWRYNYRCNFINA